MSNASPPPPLTAPHSKSVLTRITRSTTLLVKTTVTDAFSNLTKWVVLKGNPTIVSGRLSGAGWAVRYVDQMSTDSHKVTATIGEMNVGKTWLVICASVGLDKFYALEIDTTSVVDPHISIVKSISLQQTSSSTLFGVLLTIGDIFLEVLQDLFYNIVRWANIDMALDVNDTVGIWWDQPNSIIRGYINNSQVTSLAVSRVEIPHGLDHRYFGVVSDPTGGVDFTSIEAHDV